MSDFDPSGTSDVDRKSSVKNVALRKAWSLSFRTDGILRIAWKRGLNGHGRLVSTCRSRAVFRAERQVLFV